MATELSSHPEVILEKKSCPKCGEPMELVTRTCKDGVGTPKGTVWNTSIVEEWACSDSKCGHFERKD
jgi:hypothetical protein